MAELVVVGFESPTEADRALMELCDNRQDTGARASTRTDRRRPNF